MYFPISKVADVLDVSIDTVRRWDKKGLIKARRNEQNEREFNIEEVDRLYKKLRGEGGENRFEVLKSHSTNWTSIDLFAGGGGTALGLSNAGFKHLLVNEFDKHAAATLRTNRPEWNVVEGDVHEVDFREFEGKVDLVEGGFPCQAFSYAGNKLGFEDTRGTLFHEFARAVKEVRPKIAMGENVRGLLTHDGGKTLKVMIRTLQDEGYKVAYRLMKAQYFDVPQKRERLIILAVREDFDTPILFPEERDYTISLRDALEGCPKSMGAEYAPWKREIMEQVPRGVLEGFA